jgi:hypothetical protein
VFSSSSMDTHWDGNVNSTSAPEGVYSYRVEALGRDNILHRKEGQLMLLR